MSADDFYCTGDCFRCERSGECGDEERYDPEDEQPEMDLPSCPTCGRLDCEGECKMIEPDPDEDPPFERDDIGEPEVA